MTYRNKWMNFNNPNKKNHQIAITVATLNIIKNKTALSTKTQIEYVKTMWLTSGEWVCPLNNIPKLDLGQSNSSLKNVKYAIYVGKNHFELVCQSKQKLLSPLVISTVEEIISICNKENNKSKLPTLKIHLKTPDSLKYQELEAVPDTGAQVNLAGLSHLKLLNISTELLCKPLHQLKHAGGSPSEIIGSYPISVQHQGKTFNTEFYFVQNVKNLLSLDTCKEIEVIYQNFLNVNVNTTINIVNTTTKNRTKLLPKHSTMLPLKLTKHA